MSAKNNMIDLSRLLPKLMTASAENAEVRESAVKLAWKRVAGGSLRFQAVPFRLYRKTLVVWVADAIWQRQLHRMSSEFILRVNQFLGAPVIDALEFRIDPMTINQSREDAQCPRAQQAKQPVPVEVISAAAGIADADLRQRFIRAAGNCIDRRNAHVAAE